MKRCELVEWIRSGLEHAVTELAIGIAIGGITCQSAVHVNERTGGAGEPGLCLECVARASRAIWRRATTRRQLP